MKKLTKVLGAIFFVSVVLTSCGGGVEADGKKLCDLMCDTRELSEKTAADPTNTDLISEAAKIATDMQELKDKYKDDEDGKKAMLKALKDCKCD